MKCDRHYWIDLIVNLIPFSQPTMLQWIELTTKQFNACQAACEWFLDTMAEDDWWPQQILIKCPNQVVRQMFQRLIIHVIQQLRNKHVNLYLHPMSDRCVILSPNSLVFRTIIL